MPSNVLIDFAHVAVLHAICGSASMQRPLLINIHNCIVNDYMQGTPYHPITQKQADSPHIHERLAAHVTPMMLTAANVGLTAPSGNVSVGCSGLAWGLGNTTLAK